MAVVDLKIDRNIVDSKFEGYKLSLDRIPVLKETIRQGIQQCQVNLDEYSYLQVHMVTTFNQLFPDPWCPTCMFFFNKNSGICWGSLTQAGRLSSIRTVFEFPSNESHRGNFSTITFPDAEWAVATLGHGTIYLFHTPSRPVGEPWMNCHVNAIVSASSYLLHSSYLSLPNRHQIDVLFSHFHKADSDDEDRSTPSVTCRLDWLSFSCSENIMNWNLKRKRTLTGTSALLYAALDESCDAVYLASESDYEFTYDSDIPITVVETNGKDGPDSSLYIYLQTPEDVTVIFRLPETATKEDFRVVFQPGHLEVVWKDKTIVKGDLAHSIDCDCSTWIVSGDRLELIICKSVAGQMWRELIKGDDRGEELMDAALAEEIHTRLAYLTSETEAVPSQGTPYNMNELEACDAYAEMATFVRMDGNTHVVTHKAYMGGHQWLFTSISSPKSLPIICLRHDVDGIVWHPKNTSCEGETETFKIEHVATFSALGYVQASKQDKKFSSCTPDFKCAVIADICRHIFVYCQPESLNSVQQLRNRRTGETVLHVAKQYVFNLEDSQEILGMHLCNECIFVLSQDSLYALKIGST